MTLLVMVAEKELGNVRALDMNIVAIAHPDGANALISGTGGITAHFTSPPYIFEELKSENIHQVVDAFDVSAASGGLGWFTYKKRFFMDTAGVFAGLIMIALLRIILEYFIFGKIQKNTIEKWGMQVANF